MEKEKFASEENFKVGVKSNSSGYVRNIKQQNAKEKEIDKVKNEEMVVYI